MTFIVIFLIIVCSVLSYLLFISIMRNVELLDQLEDVDELVVNCSTRIEASYEKLNEKSKMEVFYDDPIVKELVSDMKDARDALIEVSQAFDQITREEADDADADAKEEK